jgi:hypothetical protein
MSVSRRKFLRSSAALSAALLFKPATSILGHNSVQASSVPGQSGLYSRAMFEPYVGDTFHVYSGNQIVELKLVAIEDLNPRSTSITKGKTSNTDCFSLQFKASGSLPATGSIQTLRHSALGTFDLFTIQSESRSGIVHTAIVNHLT